MIRDAENDSGTGILWGPRNEWESGHRDSHIGTTNGLVVEITIDNRTCEHKQMLFFWESKHKVSQTVGSNGFLSNVD